MTASLEINAGKTRGSTINLTIAMNACVMIVKTFHSLSGESSSAASDITEPCSWYIKQLQHLTYSRLL